MAVTETTPPRKLFDELAEEFPWIARIGMDPAFFHELAATATSDAEVVARIRQTPQYQQRFPGLKRQDGTLRMNEGQYLQFETDVRRVLGQYGYDPALYSTPSSLIGFMESEMDVNEISQRLGTYRAVQSSGQNIKDAFYVYAGLRVTDDDLYQAVVDPAAAQRLSASYNDSVAKSPLDYSTWITRATELGLERVTSTLSELQKTGVLTGGAVQAVLRTSPEFAKQMMDVLYQGGETGGSTENLSLQQLLESFQYAALGAAAKGAGLELPSRERVQEIRAAGVDQSKAREAYMQYGLRGSAWDANARRASAGRVDQDTFEQAAFLGNTGAARTLERASAYTEASGKTGGSFRFDVDRQGRLGQSGMRDPGT